MRSILTLTDQRDIVLVSKIDDLFVQAVLDLDRDPLLRMIRNEIHCSLDGIKVSCTVSTDSETFGIRSRSFCARLCRKVPTLAFYAHERITGNSKHRRV